MTASDQRDRADLAAGLIGLRAAVQPEALPELATFEGPPSLTNQTLRVDRLSKLCPATGRPDQFSIQVTYRPVGGRCLELESLVQYLEAYHAVAVSAERLADQVAVAVLAQTLAAWVEVTVHQISREGAELQVTARQDLDTALADQAASS
jgi:NADPH-dependent 7-cyano-7-deazaguanine reductase QueF